MFNLILLNPIRLLWLHLTSPSTTIDSTLHPANFHYVKSLVTEMTGGVSESALHGQMRTSTMITLNCT